MNKLEFFYPRMLRANLVEIAKWFKEGEIVKSLRHRRQQRQRRTRTNFDEKSSLEPSAQVSLKLYANSTIIQSV